jgi:putative ABC transport system ATP-binding protein
MQPICEIHNIAKSYGSTCLWQNVNMQINTSEMIAITGKSGSGKTTLLNMMGVLEKPDTGTITLFGDQAPNPSSRQATILRRYKIAYLFQNYALMDQSTVESNLDVALAYSNKNKQEKKKLKQQALEQVNLSIPLYQKVYELSGGEQQRLAIARILLKPFELILADEPTGSLDPDSRDEVLELLCSLNDKGKTIIIVTHDPVVANKCNRIIDINTI